MMTYVDAFGKRFYLVEEDGKLAYCGTEKPPQQEEGTSRLLQQAKEELEAYFQGRRKEFSVPLHIEATPFRKKVYKELAKIPYGEVLTYTELAQRVGNEKASRAVGTAMAKNELMIFLPCHRVVAKKGLGGFGGGLDLKVKLLEMEGRK